MYCMRIYLLAALKWHLIRKICFSHIFSKRQIYIKFLKEDIYQPKIKKPRKF